MADRGRGRVRALRGRRILESGEGLLRVLVFNLLCESISHSAGGRACEGVCFPTQVSALSVCVCV